VRGERAGIGGIEELQHHLLASRRRNDLVARFRAAEEEALPYAITLRLDAPGARRIERLWEELARRGISDSMPRLGYRPHVTLGVYDTVAPDAAVPLLHEFAARCLPLAADFIGLRSFPGAAPVLWAAPAASPDLAAAHALLHEMLGADCREHYRPGSWIPHCTLALALDEDGLHAALSALQPLWENFSSFFAGVDLVAFSPVEILWESGNS
jgi:2'-5' RNA ligase